jgi:peptide/nickel transport system substrate-binding protein
MYKIKTKPTPIMILLRLFLLASFLILPLSPTYTAHAAGPAEPTVAPALLTSAPLPRAETLYFNGLQWGPVVCWNPYSSGCNNAMAIAQQDNARVTMFETPYMYDMLDGKQYPLLADGPYTWNVARTEITFKLKAAAKWSDGTPMTAADVAYTWATNVKYGTDVGNNYQWCIDTIEAVDPQTVRVKAKLDGGGKAVNPLLVSAYLSSNYVIQKAWTKKLEARSGGNATKLLADPANDVVASGPYKKFFVDDTKVVLVRNDNYWGKDASMWGKLPAPKYLAHIIYADNNAGFDALKAGNVDVSQQFNANVQDLWLKDNLPISTYLPDAPYGIGASLPTAFYNLGSYGLDQVTIRKAIAMAVDYDMVVANATTNQSATFEQVPRSIMNATAAEQALYNSSDPAIKALQWAGNDIDGAKALLDAAGITDTNADGWREYNGTTLHYAATCPNGWTDWQAAIDLVASAGRAIGIDVTTNYPEWSVYQTVVTNWPLPAGYDIFMMWSDGAGPTQPWGRIHKLISSDFARTSNNWNGNWGGYRNTAADALIQAIPGETDPAQLKTDYTELTRIYLTDVPSFTLMYWPQSFHTVNESVWTGFPKSGDGTNPPVPPLDLTDGYSIAGLYNLTAGSPMVTSINRLDANPTSAASVRFTVAFTKTVTGVDASDFSLTTTGITGAAVKSVTGSLADYTVTVSTGKGNGTLRLNLIDNDSIIDVSGNPLVGPHSDNGSFTTGQTYTILKAGKTLPRADTLYFNGLQFGSAVCWNPYSSGCNNAMAIAQQDNARVTVFETPYVYNMLTGEQFPLLADGPYTWNVARTEITFKLKAAAKWSDGTPLTAADVAYTWATNVKYGTSVGGGYQDYIDTIEAVDPQTVLVKAKLGGGGKAVNPLMVAAYLSSNYVIQKAWTQTLEERTGGNAAALQADPAEDVVASGPYTKFFADDTKVVLMRNDSYWGKDASMWGKLPAPKYLAHIIYADNAAGFAALKAGNVDVSQQFNDNVQDLWLKDNLPISTYLPDAPYGIGASLPTAFYNLGSYGLDQVTIRKAIAMAVDYDMVVANAMTNQSATFEQVPRSIMNATPGEQALYDHAAVASLQWAGNDIDGAKALLDAAGITDTNADGWREYNGTTLHYAATCPNGWTDWQAAIDLVASAGRAIGIDVTTNYPEWSVYQTVVTNWPLTAGYDIFMMWSDGAGPAQPWGRARHLMSSEFNGMTNNWNGNWGGYSNPAADALIQTIPGETDPAQLKTDYTELTRIYLTDVPSFTLMYRPQSFHTVNESVWTNFPHQGDGTNPPVPPLDLTDGYSIAGLYNLTHGFSTPPSAPVLVSPANNALTYDLTPSLDWTDSTLKANVIFGHYHLQVSKVKTFTPTVLDVEIFGKTNSNYTPIQDLDLNTKYYWRVRAFNPYGDASAWSAVRTFRTALLAPTGLGYDGTQNLRPILSWSMPSEPGPAPTGYTLQISMNNTTFLPLVASSTTKTMSYTPSVDLSRSLGPLYWRVRANGLNGPSDWSAYGTFSTGNPPSIPKLVAPANNALVSTATLVLDWFDSTVPPLPGPVFDHYRIQVADNSAFTSPRDDIVPGPATNSSYTPTPALPAGKKFYWHVQACNASAECSDWSTMRTFRTK